jgi:hypothetical protein
MMPYSGSAAQTPSFIIGTWGFYLSWKSPDIKDIEVAVAKALAR